MSEDRDLPMSLPWDKALDSLRWNEQGLIPVTTVDAETGTVLMAAWVNKEALLLTFERKQAVYWSRSRDELWIKGMSSGHFQNVREVRVDCDGDVLLYLVDAMGPACHTGRTSCFSWKLSPESGLICDRPVVNGDSNNVVEKS